MSALLIAAGSFYPDASGGPSMTLYWLCKSLKEHGISPVILSTDRGLPADWPADTWLERDYGRVQYVRTWENERPFTLLLKSLWALRGVKTVYLPSFFYPLSFSLGIFIAIFTHKRLIWGPRGETSAAALQFGSGKKAFVLRLIRRWRHRIIFHSTSAQETDDLRTALGSDVQIVYIPNGIYLPERQPPAPDAHQDLLFLGRIHPIKGIDNLIQALALSPAFMQSNRRLLLAGYAQEGYDQTLREQIHALGLQGRVIFLGRVEGADKDQWMANACALVLPSFSENFGAVVAEALAQGTPCIAASGTPWAVLPESGAGWHVPNAPEALAEALEALFHLSPAQYAAMRISARQLAENALDIARMIPLWKQWITTP